MRTPAGKECEYFYGDYHRGRNREECRLLPLNEADKWKPRLCETCPVPDILLANRCEHMVLRARIKRPLMVLPERMDIEAYCTKTEQAVSNPYVGCGECHNLPEIIAPDVPASEADE